METKVLNYRIIVEPDKQTGTRKSSYTALCPTLGIADHGNTIEEAIFAIRGAVEAYVDSLIEDKIPVPADKPELDLVTTTQITIDRPFQSA